MPVGLFGLGRSTRVGRSRAMSARGGTASPRVVWQSAVATDAAVLELRAADSAGLLYRVAAP